MARTRNDNYFARSANRVDHKRAFEVRDRVNLPDGGMGTVTAYCDRENQWLVKKADGTRCRYSDYDLRQANPR